MAYIPVTTNIGVGAWLTGISFDVDTRNYVEPYVTTKEYHYGAQSNALNLEH